MLCAAEEAAAATCVSTSGGWVDDVYRYAMKSNLLPRREWLRLNGYNGGGAGRNPGSGRSGVVGSWGRGVITWAEGRREGGLQGPQQVMGDCKYQPN